MALLRYTEDALFDLQLERTQRAYGVHLNDEASSDIGRRIGQVMFNPLEHTPAQIARFSMMGIITGEDFVDVNMPVTPLDMNIVAHYRKDNSDPIISNQKKKLMSSISEQIVDARPGITDRVAFYAVTETDEQIDDDFELIQTNDPKEAAQAIADLCLDGLTFVLSDFEGLPLEDIESVQQRAIGVKINAPLEKEVAKARGSHLKLGGTREQSSNGIEFFNEQVLAPHHDRLAKRMELAGFAVAQTVFTLDSPYFFDVPSTDLSLAEAIDQVIQNK